MATAKFKRHYLIVIVSLMGLATATSAQALSRCNGVVATPARASETSRVPANTINCTTAGQIVAASAQIFRCRGAENAEGAIASNKVLVRPNGANITNIATDNLGYSLSAMTLYDVDLGGSAQKEHVLALWQNQSNGFGTNYWTLIVFDANWRRLETYEEVEDFGPNHLVQSGTSCALAITKYQSRDITSTRPALFYEARFVSLTNGRLALSRALPPIKRAMTRPFERQRLATFDRQSRLDKYSDLVAWLNARN